MDRHRSSLLKCMLEDTLNLYKLTSSERGSCMIWEINIGVCPRLDFENIMLFNCLAYNFNIYGAFEFFMQFHCYFYDVMNDITLIP